MTILKKAGGRITARHIPEYLRTTVEAKETRHRLGMVAHVAVGAVVWTEAGGYHRLNAKQIYKLSQEGRERASKQRCSVSKAGATRPDDLPEFED